VPESRVAGKLGRLPNDPEKPRLKLTPRIDTTVPAPPALVDWLSEVQSWPMYGNDRWGDCVWAMIGHAIEAYTTYGKGATVTLSDEAVLKGYSDVTGFDPGAGPPDHNPTDQGTVIQDALNYWKKTGVGGHKILAFAQVDHTNPDEIKAALNVFGALLVGVAFPASAMDQFDNHQPWDVVRNDGGIEGGHAVQVGHAQTDGVEYESVTWAAIEGITSAWWSKYVEECWIAITDDWLTTAGTSPQGVDLYGLGEDLASLTGEPNPFPQPTPGPTPTPDPGPSPTPQPPTPAPEPVSAADRTHAKALHRFLRDPFQYPRHRLADDARKWLASRGL
jgi:hypothetical protein